jgi:hypothetical protein
VTPRPSIAWAAIALMALALTGCQASFTTANISDATLATDEAGQNETSTFAPDDTFYYVVDLANAPDDTSVQAVWTAIEAKGASANSVIDEATITHGDGNIVFDLTNNGPWPVGSYKVDVFIDQAKDPASSAEFEVAE